MFRKCIVWTMIIFCCGMFGANAEQIDADIVENDSVFLAAEEAADPLYANLRMFIEEYNRVAVNPIEEVIGIDIQDDAYYRTEFRLIAFKDAPSLKGRVGGEEIIIINTNPDSWRRSDMRIYVNVASLPAATDVFRAFCCASGTSITNEEIEEYTAKIVELEDWRSVSIVLSGMDGYIDRHGTTYELMLKATPEYFDMDK